LGPGKTPLLAKDARNGAPGPPLGGPVLEVTVKSLKEAKARLKKKGCRVVKDEPDFPRCYVKDQYRLIYNLTR
jgi:hypothetical protein